MQLQFRDSAIHISSDADGYMNIQADTGVEHLKNIKELLSKEDDSED